MRDTIRQMLTDWENASPAARAVTSAIAAGLSAARVAGVETFEGRTAYAVDWVRTHGETFAAREGITESEYTAALRSAYGYGR
jgi:hypothetical protein